MNWQKREIEQIRNEMCEFFISTCSYHYRTDAPIMRKEKVW
jgi:hypothetical protein